MVASAATVLLVFEIVVLSLLHEQNLFSFVDLSEFHFDDFIQRGLHIAADECRFHWYLTMTTVNQNA